MWEYQIVYWVQLQTSFFYGVCAVYNTFLLLQSIGLLFIVCALPRVFRSAPLCFIYTVLWLINPLCLYLPRPQWAFQSRPSGKCSVQRDMFKNFSEKTILWSSSAVKRSTVRLYSVWNYYVPHITAVCCFFFSLQLEDIFFTLQRYIVCFLCSQKYSRSNFHLKRIHTGWEWCLI